MEHEDNGQRGGGGSTCEVMAKDIFGDNGEIVK